MTFIWVQKNNLLLQQDLTWVYLNSLQNCWGLQSSHSDYIITLCSPSRFTLQHFTFINSCPGPRKTLLMFRRLLSVLIVASSLPTRLMFFDTWISPQALAAPSWIFRTPISPMPHEQSKNPTYSMKLSLMGRRRYSSGNAMGLISICQTMRALEPLAQKQLQTLNIIQGHQVPMGKVQLLYPNSSLMSMPTCDMKTSSIHLHPKKTGSLVCGSYGPDWVWQQLTVFSPWSWWVHISINVSLLIEPSLARPNESCSLFGLPESYVSAWRYYHLALLGNVV